MPTLAACEKQLARCRRELGAIGYVSEGSAIRRAPGQAGSPFLWTRKVKAKTVSVSLSEEQYRWLAAAISNRRKAEKLLREMQRLSREILFQITEGVQHRKRLNRKVLGLN